MRGAASTLSADAWRRTRYPDERPPVPAVRPRWLALAERALAASPVAGHVPGAPADALADALGGFVAAGVTALRGAVRRQRLARPAADARLADDDVAALALARQLRRAVADAARRTLVLELHVARLRGQLRGDTPEERYTSFAARIAEPSHRAALFEEYPVLARYLAELVLHRAAACAELLGRLARDDAVIDRALAAGAPRTLGPLADLRLGLGDTHRGGRAVAALRFASGVEIIYKPRPLAVEAHYASLVAWLAARVVGPSPRAARVVDRGAYGWMEFVRAAPCRDRAHVRRFYRRHGVHLALLHVLDATDMHLENVVAAGEHPVLVDLEAALHPRLGVVAGDAAHETFAHSVLRIGLLPNGAPAGAPLGGSSDAPLGVYDRSGIGGGPGQVAPRPVPRFVDVATDTMRLETRYVEASAADNRPSLLGAPVDPADYAEEIVAGFSNAYRVLAAHGPALLAAGGPLHGFRGDEVRVVVRSTQFYATLLGQSLHPNVLRDAAARARVLDHVGASVRRAALAPLAGVESATLREGDVPRFTAHADRTDLHHGERQRFARWLAAPAYDALADRVATLGTDDLARQVALVRGAMTTLRVGVASSGLAGRALLPRAAPAVSPEQLVSLADGVAARLATLALRERGPEHDRVVWLGVVHTASGHWRLDRLGTALYDGSAGIALFLAHHGAITGDARSTSLARDVVGALVRGRMAAPAPAGEPLGAFAGEGGLIYLLAHTGTLWRDPALHEAATSLAVGCAERVAHDVTFDVIGGAAGLLKAVLALHRVAPSPALLDVAMRCGAHLVAHGRPALGGIGWGGDDERPPLLGYAHGASGIAAALAALWSVTGDAGLRATIDGALAYEGAAFRTDLGDWPDLRSPDATSVMTAWCHGAPGVALARAELLACLGADAIAEHELRHALRRTARNGWRGSHSLCHGVLGNVDAMRAGVEALGTRRADEARHARVVARIAASVARYGPICGTPHAVETPGLLTGLAGIGYGLLRLAAPDAVPSVLSLASLSSAA